MGRSWFALALLPGAALTFVVHDAEAQRARRRFEPTDLDMQEEGMAELDLQAGLLKSDGKPRAVAPDVEAQFGVTPRLQIEIDTTLGEDDVPNGRFAFLETTWVSLKIGIVDDRKMDKDSWALGVQAGPRLPTAQGTHGFGAEAIAILGRAKGPARLYFQAGTLVESRDDGLGGRHPFAVEGGVAGELDLDEKGAWSLQGELGGQHFFHGVSDQLHVALGPAYDPNDWLELSILGLVGLGGDQLGALLGATTQFKMF